jgi:hypothetical protein
LKGKATREQLVALVKTLGAGKDPVAINIYNDIAAYKEEKANKFTIKKVFQNRFSNASSFLATMSDAARSLKAWKCSSVLS